jgi:PRC-barrel domain
MQRLFEPSPEASMGERFGIVFLTTVLIALDLLSQGAAAQPDTTPSPSVTILESQEVQGILGRDVRSLADEDMGRIVDILVDGEGRVRAAIIDFGGFLGVGSRKIAVEWKALHFVPTADKRYGVVLELTRDQVKPAPEYKEGKPTVVLGASGSLEPLP